MQMSFLNSPRLRVRQIVTPSTWCRNAVQQVEKILPSSRVGVKKGMCQFPLAGFVQVHRLEQRLPRGLLERSVDQVGRGRLALAQALGQLQQVNAAQHV